jgi:16S rRNA G527 N7-methylase RsmG
MLNPDLHLVLVERKERKVAFLERVIARAGLPDVMAVAADLREFALYESHERSFDLAVMMAVTDPREAAASVERLLRVPGYFCAVRGREQELPGGSLGLRFQEIARRDTPEGRFVLYEHRQTDDCPAQ